MPVKFMSACCQPHHVDSSRPLWHSSWTGFQHLVSLPPLTTLWSFPVGTAISYMSHLVKCDKVVKECLEPLNIDHVLAMRRNSESILHICECRRSGMDQDTCHSNRKAFGDSSMDDEAYWWSSILDQPMIIQ